MAVVTFGVTYSDVRAAHFPQLQSDFSPNSKPTAAQVTTFITEEAADLFGRLLQKGVDASAISTGAATYPNAYAWCQKTLKLAAAIRVFPAITGQDAKILDRWQKMLDDRFEQLETSGYAALGDAPGPTSSATGPRSHVVDHNLDTGDDSLMSDVIPKFRRNQVL